MYDRPRQCSGGASQLTLRRRANRVGSPRSRWLRAIVSAR